MGFAETVGRIKRLEREGTTVASKEIVSFLNDPDSAVRAQAVSSLARIASPHAGRALVLALSDPDAGVKCLACAGLGKMGYSDAAAELQKLALAEGDKTVRQYALNALKQMGGAPPTHGHQHAPPHAQKAGEEGDGDEGEVQEFDEKERAPTFSDLRDVDPAVKAILETRGIRSLYMHQAEAVSRVREGKNVVVTAPTASGKTEIFLIPLVDAAREGKRSLVIYPTKALARDQLARFREFSILGVRSDVYDGDTAQYARGKIRGDFPHILITNFDMLHFMLMNSRLFGEYFKSLKYVVVDEIHTNSGSLGAHASNIVRRLKRLARHAGNAEKIQFICSSATIGNAPEFAKALCGEEFTLVSGESGPRSRVKHVIANPPLRGERRASYVTLSVKLVKKLLGEGKDAPAARKIIVFGNSHSVVERLGLIAGREGICGFHVYRSGLAPKARKKLEDEFKSGAVRVLAATSALELGMDIGSVDAVVLAGYPGTVSRVRQRVGRCGRKGQEAVAVFVARDNPLDQYFVENPEKYLNGKPESCYANPDNEYVLKWHVLALMRDWPADAEEIAAYSPASGMKVFDELRREGMCKEYAGGWIPTKDGLRRLQKMGIRGTGETIRIVDSVSSEEIGERERPMAMKELFPGAIYLHGGMRYVSKKLDMRAGIALVEKAPAFTASEYTTALSDRNAEVVEELFARDCLGGRIHFGKVHIHEVVTGYVVKNQYSDETLDKCALDEPLENEFDTFAIWLDLPPSLVSGTEKFGDGLHAFEHCSISMIPALTGADSNELGGISYPSGRMFVYDGVPLGSGVTRIVFDRFEEVVAMTAERLSKCPCKNGCPSCVLDPQCGNNNRHLDKHAGRKIADGLLARK